VSVIKKVKSLRGQHSQEVSEYVSNLVSKYVPKNVICNILLNVSPKQEKPEIHFALKLIN